MQPVATHPTYRKRIVNGFFNLSKFVLKPGLLLAALLIAIPGMYFDFRSGEYLRN